MIFIKIFFGGKISWIEKWKNVDFAKILQKREIVTEVFSKNTSKNHPY
jgi:hypothetical protein